MINVFYMYMFKTFLKIIWWQFLLPYSEHTVVSSATLSCKTQNVLTLSTLVYYNTNSFLWRSFSLIYCLTARSSLSFLIITLKLHCFMLLLNFITSNYFPGIAGNAGNHGNNGKFQMTKHLTKLKQTLTNYVWEKSHFKKQ